MSASPSSSSAPKTLLLAQDGLHVLVTARSIAAAHGHQFLNTNHILLGILETPGSLGAQVLERFPIKIEQMKSRLWAYIRLDSGEDKEPYGGEFYGFALSEDGARAMAEAVAEGEEQGLDFIDSRVIILGMLRAQDTEGGEILRQFEITADAYRARAALDRPPMAPATSRAAPKPKPRKPKGAATRRGGMRLPPISPVFLLLLAVFFGLGYLLYAGIGNTGWNTFLFVLAGWILAVSLHEFGHALVAYWAGDTSVVYQGYLTLNPLKYTHPVLSIVFPIIFLLLGGIPLPGGAVYINRAAIRKPWMLSAVSAAGPFMTLLFGLVLMLPFIFGLTNSLTGVPRAFWSALAVLAFLQFFAFVLNLIPWPGLDGFGILEPWLPPSILQYAYMLGGMGIFFFFFLFVFTPFGSWVVESVYTMMMAINVEATYLAAQGFRQFTSVISLF
jgi:Zn-dependent protease